MKLTGKITMLSLLSLMWAGTLNEYNWIPSFAAMATLTMVLLGIFVFAYKK